MNLKLNGRVVVLIEDSPYRLCYSSMNKTEILEELLKLTKTGCEEIRLKLAELDGEDWRDDQH